YKAAYYKGGGTYSLYANGTSVPPVAGIASNCGGTGTWDGTIYGFLEQNGTKDMMGNVWEWNEANTYIGGNVAWRGLRGGSYTYDLFGAGVCAQSTSRYDYSPIYEFNSVGFRVVQIVPEPSSIIALLGGLTGLIGLRRRKA
ncbi:MAG: PEP-CTERM sorting domain-containing protein, partial [bacterium]